MKWQAVIILFAIAVSIAVPPSLSLTVVRDKRAAIGVLDVCHSAAPALFSSSDMPCICACRNQIPALSFASTTVCKPVFNQSLFSLENEHPPQA